MAFSLLYNAPKFFELYTGVTPVLPFNVNVTSMNETIAEEKPLEPTDPEEAEVEYAYRIMPTTMRINEVYIQVRLDEIQINVPHLLTEFVFLS